MRDPMMKQAFRNAPLKGWPWELRLYALYRRAYGGDVRVLVAMLCNVGRRAVARPSFTAQ
ncbi:hypothetical protein [Actinomadura sediminis]|uniref:Uncharacterized protein n=1 Tax=Actinomadura sediminis TaxID=1038904 RepID=A0ABW3ER54_9ACTN